LPVVNVFLGEHVACGSDLLFDSAAFVIHGESIPDIGLLVESSAVDIES
jgi:hypothetical protein